jgi:hypothetical protein
MNQPTPPPDKPQGAEPIAETPRTESAKFAVITDRHLKYEVIVVHAEIARQLERELTAATEALEKAKAELAACKESIISGQKVLREDAEHNAARAEQSGKREAALREALLPFARFHRAYKSKPMRGVGDEFYGIHSGTEWEANLKHSDMARAYTALSQQAPTNDTQPI